MLFNKAVSQEVSGWQPMANNNNPATIKKVSSPLNQNAVAAMNYQFTEWYAPNGLHISIVVDPWYDKMIVA